MLWLRSKEWSLGVASCAAALWLAALGCGGSQSEPEEADSAKPPLPSLAEAYGDPDAETGSAEGALDVGKWPRSSRSPQPAGAVSGPDGALYQRCGEPDRALTSVASRVLERRLDGEPPYAPREIELLLRARGLPQVWPRALVLAGLADGDELLQRVESWTAAEPARGQRRCGLARGADREGEPLVAFLAVDALADLEPLPTRVRLSTWLELGAVIHVPADEVHVLLLGPQGRPRKVPASLSGGRIRSRFSLDQPGPWLVQVLASLASGPLPVLEARVFAGVKPTAELREPPAPGKAAGLDSSRPAAELAAALARRVNEARRVEHQAPVGRDAGLDAVATEHAQHMASRGRLAHDLGRGTVGQRLTAAGFEAGHVGENVAAARTIDRAFEALWASPSHRDNVLASSFRRFGVGVVRDDAGMLWVTQVFSE
ncbi:MAG: CAP domain-containing protein [Deltaproteobacteria bacterium]|jgi:uncharacterized protein YkwD|nr:CAP domain-containing protein [Deltaproteobacteria bacterium]MBW2531323.1 CAP domain-containing protein [Deltaproteobacteria bacterium]